MVLHLEPGWLLLVVVAESAGIQTGLVGYLGQPELLEQKCLLEKM